MLTSALKCLLIILIKGIFVSSIKINNGNYSTPEDFISTTSSTVSVVADECERFRPCPPLDDDVFHMLHNYTDPRPITAEEVNLVVVSCFSRSECCYQSWNWSYTQMASRSICFCIVYTYTWCDGVHVTKGNLLVIITIFRFMNRESVTNIFIANLSFGDILVIGFALPFRFTVLVLGFWMWDDWLCKCVWLVYYTSLMVSSFTMTALAIERYLVICHPMKSKYISTPGRAKKIVATVWVAAISLSSVPASFIKGDMAEDDCSLTSISLIRTRSKSSIIFVYYVFAVAFMVPLFIIIFAYTNVGISLHKSVKEARSLTRSGRRGKLKSKDEDLVSRIQVVKMLVIVLVTFIVTWFPTFFMNFVYYNPGAWNLFHTYIIWKDLQSILTLLTFINSCLNPIFYALYSKTFREGFVKCFSRCHHEIISRWKQNAQLVAVVDNGITATTFSTTSGTCSVVDRH